MWNESLFYGAVSGYTRKLAKVGKIILQIIADEAFDDDLLQKSNVDLASMASMWASAMMSSMSSGSALTASAAPGELSWLQG